MASFASILKSHKAVVAFFTSNTCAPCKMIEPVFKELAADKAREGLAFVEVNSSVGMSGMISRDQGVTATPTFIFYHNGVKVILNYFEHTFI
jgi:desumoylating isopeptidase 1